MAQHFEALDFRAQPPSSDGSQACRIVARPEKQQELIDQLQGVLGRDKAWRITLLAIAATIPELEPSEKPGPSPEQATQEEFYAEMVRGARIDSTFLLLVVVSTIVAAIGLIESNVTIIIAAMLVAPLLGPNVAMALGSTLGDRELLSRAVAVGLIFPMDGASAELMVRTRLGYDSIVLALASGAAGALSFTTRLPGTLVGVMVAMALLPPAVTLGYMLGNAQPGHAAGAAALLAVNVVCVNLSAQLIFLSKGIKPRTWLERRAAKESIEIGLAIAGGLLTILIGIVYWQHT